MCSVSFLPDPNGGFILTSNRDEAITRQANPPEHFIHKGKQITFPCDAKVMGSWIAADKSRAVCLLNGAYEKHKHNPPYRMSRGIVLIDLLCDSSIFNFYENYDFTDIEPFTSIYADKNPLKLYTLVWDGKYADLNELDASKPYFWSSSTLYDADWRKTRNQWFNQFVNENLESKNLAEDIVEFHRMGGEQNTQFDLVMSRNNGNLRTISITRITSEPVCRMYYLDLLNQQEYNIEC